MKSRKEYLLIALAMSVVSSLNSPLSTAFAQGSLTPPGPPAPAMKSLDQIEPRTPISSLPFSITTPGSYYLATNLTGVSGTNGITIASGNVTLDLKGFVLAGVPGSRHGVYVATNALHRNLTVCNGTVRAWGGNGVEAFSAENAVFERLTVSDTGGFGIDAYGSLIRDCQVDSSGDSGISASVSEIRDCVVENTGYDGIDAYDSQVRDCVVENNVYGIYVAPGKVSGCLIESNLYSGIYVGSSGCQITRNTCLGNNLNAGASEAGIYLNAGNNRVEDNHVAGSGYAGIQVASGGPAQNLILKNSVSGNGANNYVTPGQQIVGPLITATGTITNSSPWANFSN
jgi:parallel beta-helix repeat protein